MSLRYEILKACAANPGAPVDEIADAIKHDRKKTGWAVRVNDLTLLGKRDSDAQHSAPAEPPRQAAPARTQPSGSSQGGFGDFDDSDIPF